MPTPTRFQRGRQQVRVDDRDPGGETVVAYLNENGKPLAWQGDDIAPWVIALTDSDAPLNVIGQIAHDDPDNEATNFPVKVGGHANASPRTPVSAENDIADLSVDLQGRARVRVSGINEASNVSADVPLDAANALEVGGQVQHGSPDEGYPLKIGGHAYNETPPAVADDNRVDQFYTLESRLVNVQDLLNAGEDLVNDVLRTVPGALAVEEHSLDKSYLAGSATNVVVKSTAGRAYIVIASNPTGGTLYLQLHNLAAAPGGGAVPAISPVPVPAGGVASLDLNEYGEYCSVGIVLASSSVFATFTGAAGLHITTWFK